MSQAFSNLFRKGKIGKLEIRNRTVMLPMSTNFPNENGGVTTELIDYYAERAKGGVGLVIVESACVDFPVGRNGATKLRCDQINFVPGLSRLVDAIHLYGAKAILQLQHAGASTSRENTFGHQPVAPSNVENSSGQIVARELSVTEIENIISGFAQSAKYAKDAGFDGIEIHAAHSYLIVQFLTPCFNRRTDRYGGTLDKRSRFLLEIVKSIRKEVGSNLIISVRMNGEEFTEGGLDIQDAKKIAALLEDAGVDMLNISTGLKQHSENLSMYYPQGWRVYLAKEIKQIVKIPVIATGGIRDPEYAEKVLSAGDADFIGLGRGLIADPFWPAKAAKGCTEKIRKCISCNIGCTDRRIFGNRSIRCSVNPDVGQEGRARILPSICSDRRKVVVIGAGAAGINAAIEVKKRGHCVEIIEKEEKIGGLLHLASVPYRKVILQSYINYLQEALIENDIKIHFNEEATFDKIRNLNPDAVVFATGSQPIIPESIPGIKNENVVTAYDVLRRKYKFENKKIIVLGGGSIGCETSDYLAEKNKVTIIELCNEPALELEKIHRADLLKRLKDNNVNVMLNTKLEKINETNVTIRLNDTTCEIPADFIVLAVGTIPVLPDWVERIHEIGADYFVIGDAYTPGKLIDAVGQGAAVGRTIWDKRQQ